MKTVSLFIFPELKLNTLDEIGQHQNINAEEWRVWRLVSYENSVNYLFL